MLREQPCGEMAERIVSAGDKYDLGVSAQGT